MDVLLIIVTVMGVVLFAGLAALFGADSRETLGDDWTRPLRA
ncbi:MAG TPA: hypothetical protein VNM34_01060 [Verrucomicrobiae bacterium]|nr:hypothetical protein [Verrucomicrobiae bacterium]